MSSKKNYVCVRVKPLKLNRAIAQAIHDTRKKVPGYIRTSEPKSKVFRFAVVDSKITCSESTNAAEYEHLKSDLKALKQYQDVLHEKIKKRKRKSDANDFISGILVFSDPSAVSETELRNQAMRYLAKISQRYGVLPVYLIEHQDELKTHFHFLLPNLDREAKAISNRIDKTECSKLQDLAGETFADLGFSRGENTPADETPRKHYTVLEGHKRELKKAKKQKLDAVAEASQAEVFLSQVLAALDEKKELLAKHEQLLKNTIDTAKREKAFLRESLIQQEKEIKERKAEYKKYDEEIRRIREERKTILDEKNQLLKEQSDLKAKLKSIRENFTDEIRAADREHYTRLLALDAFERLKTGENTKIYDPVIAAIEQDNVDFMASLFRSDMNQEADQKR